MGRTKKQDVVSQSEFGKLLGISPTSVARHVKAGHITERSLQYSKSGKPKILVEYAIEDMEKRPARSEVRQTRGGTMFGGNMTTGARAKAGIDNKKAEQIAGSLHPAIDSKGNVTVNGKSKVITQDGIELDFDRDPENLAEAKVREAIAKAVKLELENKKLRGTLVDIELERRNFAVFAVNLKRDLAALGARLGAQVASETSHVVCGNLINKEVEDILVKHSIKWPK